MLENKWVKKAKENEFSSVAGESLQQYRRANGLQIVTDNKTQGTMI
jgi:hypothetical protein